ncbi:metabotropic glutamate receptor 3-like [Tachypleus tridentatus]|uniref:metabotropic glutamate receptor 3-like n=1 Tax=Tachypleus tridentatus TaxID=6853 RepID=UPI003FD12656
MISSLIASQAGALLFAANIINIIQTSIAKSSVSGLILPDIVIENPTTILEKNNDLCLAEWCEIRNSSVSGPLRLRGDLWIVPLIILSSLNIVVIACFEAYVLYKAHGTAPSRRHLFLGQMLLLGLFLCSITGFAFVPTAHTVTCTLICILLGLAYTLVFATLLVKLVFLLSLQAGIYLPASYQGLLLFFIVIVQVVINVQWVVQRLPGVVISQTALLTCDISVVKMMLTLIYPMFLIFCVTILSFKTRRNRENHREAMFIAIAVGFTIPVWIIWILVAIATEPYYHDASIGFGIILNATIIFLVMFLPKGRQLAAMGREGLYSEDRNALSSQSSLVCTPSFLHIEPPTIPLNKNFTLFQPTTITKPATPGRSFYLPPPPGRIWRYSYPVFPHSAKSSPEDRYFYPGEGTKHRHNVFESKASFNPNVTFFRAPLY